MRSLLLSSTSEKDCWKTSPCSRNSILSCSNYTPPNSGSATSNSTSPKCSSVSPCPGWPPTWELPGKPLAVFEKTHLPPGRLPSHRLRSCYPRLHLPADCDNCHMEPPMPRLLLSL